MLIKTNFFFEVRYRLSTADTKSVKLSMSTCKLLFAKQSLHFRQINVCFTQGNVRAKECGFEDTIQLRRRIAG
jgi:hypothetical protein